MDLEMKILRPEDFEQIQEFELARLQKTESDPMERELQSWHARWRAESFEHYVPQGWSFGVWQALPKPKLQGYFLAQPLLFFEGLTQSLWIEHFASASDAAATKLLEIAYRWCRDKHLQRLLISGDPLADRHLGSYQ